MTMAFWSGDGLEPGQIHDNHHTDALADEGARRGRAIPPPIIVTKLQRPDASKWLVQDRLIELLDRSVRNHSATLLVGRAGSGKTALAAKFAERVPGAAWYSLDAGDSDWAAFSRHFRALICGANRDSNSRDDGKIGRTPLELLADVAADLDRESIQWPELLVLDGIHHLYDSDWFTAFFDFLIWSLSPPAHVLILSRSKPPNPLWRLRSKQVLNVVDEKLLAFSASESEELFKQSGLTRREGKIAHRDSFGRAGKLMRILEAKRQSVANA